MTDFDIIIAGGGHNGLACGAVLARAGLFCTRGRAQPQSWRLRDHA